MYVGTVNSEYLIENGRIWKMIGSEHIVLRGECFKHVAPLAVGNSMILEVHGYDHRVITSPVVAIYGLGYEVR